MQIYDFFIVYKQQIQQLFNFCCSYLLVFRCYLLSKYPSFLLVVDVMALVDIILLAAEDQKVVIDIDAGDTGIGYGDAGTGPAHARENNLWDRE